VDGDNLYFPYFTSGINGSKFDAFVQKIGSDGSLPWGENGKDISTGTYFETKTNIGIFGDYVWAISTFTNSTQGPRGEFAQKINKNTGDILFGESAKQVYPLASGPGAPTHMSSIEFLGTTPVFVTADNTITSSALALGAVTLDDSGNILSEKVLSGASVKSNINVISDGEQLIAVWGDARENSTPRMYAQNYKLDATLATQDASFSLDYKIYPNPVVSNINILTSKKIRQVSIYDTNGRNILNSKEKTFSLEKLGSAIYILKTIFEDGKTVSNKIIKK
jgi:hypothetical protein